MIIQVNVQISSHHIPLDYRRLILHFIKTVLSEEDEELFDSYYSKGANERKPFTFWASLSGAKFLDKSICMEQKQFTFFISSDNTKLSFLLYNGFKKTKKLSMGENDFAVIDSVKLRKVKEIKESEVIINMLSPLVVRKHVIGEKDKYILFNEEGFNENFDRNICSQLDIREKEIRITPIKCKKVIVKAYGTNIPSSLGVFKLEGDVNMLKKLYLTGMGSKSSAGFGKFEIIG